MSVEQNKKIAIEVLNAVNEGKREVLERLLDDDVKWWVIGGDSKTVLDKKTLIHSGKIIIDAADSPFNFTYGDITGEDDRVLVEAWGDMKMKTGKTYANVYVFKLQIRNGKIIAGREFLDTKLADDHLAPLFQKKSA